MKAKLTVVAVSCLLAACGGDPEGNNTNGMPNNENNTNNANNTNNENNTSGSNNGMNNPTNNETNNANNPTNNGTNTPTNNGSNNPNNSLGRGLAASADFGAGTSAWHAATLDDQMLSDNAFGSGDVAVTLGDAWAYVLDRNGSQVQVLDADLGDMGIIDVSGVGTTNPFAATDAGGSAYISLFNVGEIAVATPNGADWDQERLDLSSYDADGNPEPAAMLTDEGFVVVVLQTLQNFMGVDNSQLLVIDSSDNSMSAIDLGVTNAQAGLRWAGDNLAVGVTGDFGANDGGILLVTRDAAGSYSAGTMAVTEDDLGGDLLDFVFVDETTAYAVITLPDFSSQLLEVDLSTGVDVNQVPEVTSPGFGGLDVSQGGNYLAVGERATGAEKFVLLSLNGDDDIELPTTQPPSGFVFMR